MTRLFLVRHGATVWHEENRYAGSSDVALHPSGYAQAERLATWASEAKLAAIWCSPLTRAQETAAPAARATQLIPHLDERLREIDFGQIEGKTMAEAQQLFPEEIRCFKADPATYPMPGGENPHEAAHRAVSALRDIAATHPTGRVLVVAHNTLIRLALCSVMGIPLARYRTVFPAVRNGALTEIQLEGENAALIQYNSPLGTADGRQVSESNARTSPRKHRIPTMSTRILVAGDHFILPSIFADAIRAKVKDPIEFREYQSPWPRVPFGEIGEVTEASGSEDEIIQALQGVSIYVANHAPLTKKVLESAPDLKLAVIARGGPTNANVLAATECGVLVCNAPGRNATATAEHTVSLILAVLRRIPETHAPLARGEWRGDYYEYDQCGLELEDSTAGLIGYGAIGSRVARMLRGFGCHVLVHDPYLKPEALGGLAQKVELDEMLSRSRIVSLHARATPETKGMIGAKQLAAMPAGSVLINCARGTLVDYDAVCDALDSGHLWGAGFDVFPEEPIPADSRLLRTPHIVMTPHIAGASKQTAEKAAVIAAGEVARFLHGEPLEHCVNPEAAGKSTG